MDIHWQMKEDVGVVSREAGMLLLSTLVTHPSCVKANPGCGYFNFVSSKL